jgi:hypothetical protein
MPFMMLFIIPAKYPNSTMTMKNKLMPPLLFVLYALRMENGHATPNNNSMMISNTLSNREITPL